MKKQIICKDAPAAIGPYSQAIAANGMLFVSGQLPVNVATGEVPESIAEQTKNCLENIKKIITEAGGSMDGVVKCCVYLKDMNKFAEMNGVYEGFFNVPAPARLTVEVARLPKDVGIEIDAIAVL